MKYRNLLVVIASLCCTNTFAATYYVDAKNGNDNWSGTSSTVSAPNGPWQSIAKVNTVTFQPGDQILFSCGQAWYETLKPVSNGTATAKIYFGSYPAQCTNKPKLTGVRQIPSYGWQLYQGNIWKTTFPQNLIINGTLQSSVSNWAKWPTDASMAFNSSCPLSVIGCMNFIAGSSQRNALASSNIFSVVGGKKYLATLSIFAPTNTTAHIIVRESGNSYRTLGLVQKVTGNNQWQNLNVTFTATHTVTNARFDVDIPQAKQVYLRNVRITENGILPKPSIVLFNNDPVTVAHHPNAGHDITNPQSVYFRTTAASPTVKDSAGRNISSQIYIPNLKLPSGGSIIPGTKLRIRSLDYRIDDFSVTQATASTLSITPNTPYPLSKAGNGFYFYDARWMLDSAGEWFFDESAQTLYLWTPNNQNPGNLVSVATGNTGIELTKRTNITVDNLEIDGTSTGVAMSSSQNVTLQYLYIHNLDNSAVLAQSSSNPTINNNRINRVSSSGVVGIHAKYSKNANIQNNELTESGVFVKAGKPISLPMTIDFGIFGGSGSFIADNTLTDIGGNGIETLEDGEINSNVIQRSCQNINDCGAIYVAPASLNNIVRNNLVMDVTGNLDGTPDGTSKNLNGIYLDDGISGITVNGNTVKGAINGIYLHNASRNNVTGNILYGNEARQIWVQEDAIINGGIIGNTITDNQLFPNSKSSTALHSNTIANHTDKFATYDRNHYSVVNSPIVALERGLQVSKDYTFFEWQNAKTVDNLPRDNELNGGTPAPLPSFAQGLVGTEFMPNGDFTQALDGWRSWNATAPKVTQTLVGCLPISVNCIQVTAGGSSSLVHSPKFSVTKGKRYRITFDMKTTSQSGYLYPQVLFAGPTNYTSLMVDHIRLVPFANWKRYSFIFEATETAANPAIDNQGARFQINGIPSGQSVWIANLEIAQFNPGTLGPTHTDMLVNTTDIHKQMDCPTRSSNPSLCSNFVVFPESTAATWPITVAPRSGRIVFTQNFTLLDTDNDTIANSQDDCPATAKGETVNGRGCGIND